MAIKSTAKKWLATVLALIIVLSSMAAVFTVSAATAEVYQVTYASPAVPMVVNTRLDLSNISVQLEKDGAFVNGASLDWATDYDGIGISFNAVNKTITAYVAGPYIFTVTDNSDPEAPVSRQIVLSVAKTADGPFDIYEFDFKKFANRVDDWAASYIMDRSSDGCPGFTTEIDLASQYEYSEDIGGVKFKTIDSVYYLKDNAILSSFADFTVRASVGSTTTSSGVWTNFGIVARVVPVSGTNNVGDGQYSLAGYSTNNTATFFGKKDNQSVQGSPITYANNTFYDFEARYSGKTITLSIGVNGTYQQFYTETNNDYPTNAGMVGVYGIECAPIVKTLSVSLNDVETLPTTVAVSPRYTVAENSPVIPMLKNTKVNLSDLIIDMGEGNLVLGSKLSWATDYVGSAVSIRNGAITAYLPGVYQYTVTDTDGNTKRIAVSVCETKTSEITVYEYDFANLADDIANGKNKWKLQNTVENEDSLKIDWTMVDLSDEFSYDVVKEAAAFTVGYKYQALYLDDEEYLGNFANYTLKVTGATQSPGEWDVFGAMTRVTLKGDNRVLTSASSYFAPAYKTVGNQTTNNAQTLFRVNNGATADNGWGRDITGTFAFTSGVFYDLYYKLDGRNVIMSAALEGETPVQYFDLYAACDDKTKTDYLDKRIPTAGGTIGLYFAGYKYYIKSITMTAAVSSDWPEATAVEPLKELTSKVIPMNALTKLDLSKYLIDGVRGDLFTWTSDSENVSVSDGYVLAYAKGAYTLTGNYNGKKTEIYVVVKEETETEWTVYDKTFTENAIPEDWHAQYYFTNGSKFADITQTYTGELPYKTNVTGIFPFDYDSAEKKATAVGAGGAWVTYGYLTLDNDIVSSLQDYTIEVEMLNFTQNYGFGTAIFARAVTDENGKIYASTSYDAVFDAKSSLTDEWKNRNGAGHLVSTSMALTPTYKIDSNSWNYVGWKSTKLAKYNVKYSGSTVTFWSPEDATNVFTVNGIAERNGAVGIVTDYIWDGNWGNAPLLHSFRVKLNTKEGEQPKAEKMDIYKVTDASPAIPMNAMTVVNTSDLLVEIDGTAYLGSQVTFASSTTNDGLKIENGEIKAYREGLYPVTVSVTDNSRNTHTRTIYVVVKERTESEWVIYSQTFGDLGVTANDTVKVSDVLPGWQSQLFTSQFTTKYPFVDNVKGDGIGDNKLIYINYEYLPKYNYMPTWNGTPFKGLAAPGVIPFANYYSYGFTEGKLNYFDSETNTGYKYSLWDGTGLFTLSNSVVSQFSDYTITSNMYSHVAFDGEFGSGVFGRMTVNSNGLIDNNSGEYSLFFTSNKSNNGNVYTRTIKGEGINPSTTKISTDAWNYANSSEDAQVSLSVKYSGTTATMFSVADSEKKTFTIDNVPQVKGGVGVVTHGVGDQQNNGCFVNIKEFKVTLNDTEDTMPISTDIVDPTDAKVLKNTVYNLANYKVDEGVMGYSAQFDSVVTTVGEVVNNKLVAFSAGTIDITANYSDSEGQTTSKVITITVVENIADANVISNPLFDSSLTIAPATGVNGRYYVTVTAPSGMQLENGVIALDDNGTKSVINATQDATGVKFAFNTADITAVKLEPSFIAEKEAYLNGLGATIRLASSGKETGIRFGFRTSVLKGNGQISYIADDVTLENNDCEILEIGTIILPAALIPANEELNINTAKAKKVVTSSLVLSSAAYSDFASVLVGIPTENYDTDVSARGYLKVKVNGTEQYIYSDVVTRSYNDVLSAIYPAGGKTGTDVMFEDVFTGGTNHQLDSDPASNDLTYEIGEEITFTYVVKGGYKLNYKLYKDDAEQNLYGNESVITEYVWNNKTSKSDLPYNCCVLSGSANDGILKVTTKMKQAGMVKLYVQVLGENNAEITNFTSSVAVDFDNITQNSASVLEKSELETFYNTLTSGADAILTKVREEVESETFTAFWNNRSETSNYDGTYIKIRALGKRGGDYLAYDVQIATDETVKTQSTGENGLFAYTDYNTRPASGILIVPVDAAASSLGIDADFQGYGCGSAGTSNMGSGVFTLHMNSHGFLNDQATEYYTNHNNTTPENGGVKGFDFTAEENAETDATKLYFYGMLKRDYVGLQFVKMLPEFNLSKGITTRGGSQGGFQSVAVGAMDSDVKTVNATYCWMGTLGGYESGDIMSTFMPFVTDARKYYNTAGLAKLLGSDVKLVLETGLGDYTAPPQGVISIYNAASCSKSIKCVQYWEHGPVRANNSYASIKSYDVQ